MQRSKGETELNSEESELEFQKISSFKKAYDSPFDISLVVDEFVLDLIAVLVEFALALQRLNHVVLDCKCIFIHFLKI